MLIPLNAALICRIKEEVKRVLLYSYTRLAIASPQAIGMLYGGYSVVREGGIVELFVELSKERVVNAN